MAAAKVSYSGGIRGPRRKISKSATNGHAYIKSTFNNTIASPTDPTGAVVAWAPSGRIDSKGLCKPIPFTAQLAAEAAVRRAQEHGTKKVDAFVKGPGFSRKTMIRSFQVTDLKIGSIQDVMPQVFNGIRPSERHHG